MLKQIAKIFIPDRYWNALKVPLANRRLNAAIRALMASVTFTDAELREFREAWGNQGFSADNGFVGEVARAVLASPGDVLECGSGATTVLAAILGLRHGFSVHAFEQDPLWRERVRHVLRRHGLKSTLVLNVPLTRFSDHAWYDVPELALPMHFTTVICDGPFIAAAWGSPFYENWRYGILPWLHATGRTFDVLLLDDFDDKRCAPLLERWQREFGVSAEIKRSECGAHAVLKYGGKH